MATRKKQTSEAAVREIRRKTRRRFAPEENFLRVRRRMSRTAASVDCLFCLVMRHSSGSSGPRQMSLSLGPLNVRILLTGYTTWLQHSLRSSDQRDESVPRTSRPFVSDKTSTIRLESRWKAS